MRDSEVNSTRKILFISFEEENKDEELKVLFFFSLVRTSIVTFGKQQEQGDRGVQWTLISGFGCGLWVHPGHPGCLSVEEDSLAPFCDYLNAMNRQLAVSSAPDVSTQSFTLCMKGSLCLLNQTKEHEQTADYHVKYLRKQKLIKKTLVIYGQ